MKKTLTIIASVGLTVSLLGSNAFAKNYYESSTSIPDNSLEFKEEIQNKMVNSIDYFNKAKGTYTFSSKTLDVVNNVDFQVELGDKSMSYTKLKVTDNFKEKIIERKYNGDEILYLDQINKKYKKFADGNKEGRNKDSKLKGTPAKERYIKENGKIVGVHHRKDPSFMTIASEVLFNQNIALGYLNDYSKWNIVDETNYLGFDAVVINGTLDDYYQVKHKAVTFTLWVDKNTGILLKNEEYDNNGDVVDSLIVNKLKLTENLDSDKFKLDIPHDYAKDQE